MSAGQEPDADGEQRAVKHRSSNSATRLQLQIEGSPREPVQQNTRSTEKHSQQSHLEQTAAVVGVCGSRNCDQRDENGGQGSLQPYQCSQVLRPTVPASGGAEDTHGLEDQALLNEREQQENREAQGVGTILFDW